jgi:hypothetical protein
LRLRFTVLSVAILCVAALLIWLTHAFWTRRLAETLVCTEHVRKSDALVLENFDPPDYPVFKRAAELQKMRLAGRVFVPVPPEGDLQTPNEVSKGIAEVMARVAGLSTMELIPIQLNEPITLNAVKQILVVLMKEHVTSVVVVSPAFRSERAWLVHNAVLAPAGIQVGCAPAFGFRTPNNWTRSWHGMENVSEQVVKLMYYRFWVLL